MAGAVLRRSLGWVCVWAALAVSPAAADWGAVQTVGGGALAAGLAPRIAVDAEGNTTIAWAGVSTVSAVSGSSDGQWGQPQLLGVSSDGNVDVAVDPVSGMAVAVWSELEVVRTATRPLGGAWTIPAIGQPGTFMLAAGAQVSKVVAAIDANGQAAVAWEAGNLIPPVQFGFDSGGTWSAGPETVPLTGLVDARMVRGPNDRILLVSGSGGFTTARRQSDATWVPFSASAEVYIEGLTGDPESDALLIAAYVNTEFRLLRASITSNPPNDTTVVRQVTAMRPPLSTQASGGGVAVRRGAGATDSVIVWLDGTTLLTSATHGGLLESQTLAADAPAAVAVARPDGDDIVVAYTDGGGQPGVKAFARTPCASGTWAASPVTLESGTSLGPVRAAAGGEIATAAWVDAMGNVRAAIFTGTAIPPQGVCVTPPSCATAAAVPSFQGDTLSLLDLGTGDTLKTVTVGDGPYGVAVRPGDDSVWVTNRESNSVSVLTSGGNTTATIAVPAKPLGIVFDPTGARAFVASYDEDVVAIIDAETRTVQPNPIKVGSGPTGIAVSADGLHVWTANYGDNTVSIIDLSTTPATVHTTRKQIFRPLGIVVQPDNSRAYVTGFKSNRVLVIDPLRPRRARRIKVGRRPIGIALAPAPSTLLYVVNSKSGTVSVIDTTTNRVVGRIPTGKLPYSVAIEPSGRYVFVVESGTSALLEYDLQAGAAARRIPIPGGIPVGLGDFLLRGDVCQ